jgi:predicted metal-dependent peptidase
MSDKNLTNEEFLLIARDLELHHAVFSKIWNVGKPRFTDKIPTACVTFDKNGNHIDFQFNPNFWEGITPYERNFVICHECLHIMLSHGVRLKELNRDIGNVAADVVINEMLVQGFGFDRNKLDWVGKNGCWMNTVFKDSKLPVEKDRSMEYYYKLLKQEFVDSIKKALKIGAAGIPGQGGKGDNGKNGEQENGSGGGYTTIDDHEGLMGMDPTDLDDVLGDILDGMNDVEKESLDKSFKEGNPNETESSAKEAGSMPGNLQITVKVGFVKKKKKWETVIKKWANTFLKQNDKDHEQWARVNRRFVGITSTMSNMFLPSEMEIDEREEEKRKIKVVFFQDTSGSCSHLAERFFKAAKSLPTNRFEVELYCFDTDCYKTSLESGKLYGFGGTSFYILEEEVMKICKGDMSKYPKAVFVITDGYGDQINPKKPKNWYWFLSEDYRHCIPKECNIFDLKDFE